ncbi:MAG: TlyA family RNA methyltransferase [Verrucomicrobiota bacterium]
MAQRIRLDQLLVEQGEAESREKAKRLILAGAVKVAGHVCDKPSRTFAPEVEIELRERPKYVGRGGFKLEGALRGFGIDPTGRVCLDIGASTGGFTDCLLQHGAERVHAIDVGTNQLVWKLRNDPRVHEQERFNARQLDESHLGERVSLIVVDVSFISLTKILPAAFGVLEPEGEVIALVKPQFELRREEIGKGGVVRDANLHHKAVAKIRRFVEEEQGKRWSRVIESPIKGTDGNREFLAWLRNA